MNRVFGPNFPNLFEVGLPFMVAIFCVLLTMLPLGLSSGIIVSPAFALMAIFYWALYRPELMPPYAVFLVGLYYDLASAGPLGLWAFIYLVVYGIVLSQRLFFIGRAFFAIWVAFGMVALIAGLMAWGVSGLYYGSVVSPLAAFGQALVSFVLYPLFGRMFGSIQRRFLSQV